MAFVVRLTARFEQQHFETGRLHLQRWVSLSSFLSLGFGAGVVVLETKNEYQFFRTGTYVSLPGEFWRARNILFRKKFSRKRNFFASVRPSNERVSSRRRVECPANLVTTRVNSSQFQREKEKGKCPSEPFSFFALLRFFYSSPSDDSWKKKKRWEKGRNGKMRSSRNFLLVFRCKKKISPQISFVSYAYGFALNFLLIFLEFAYFLKLRDSTPITYRRFPIWIRGSSTSLEKYYRVTYSNSAGLGSCFNSKGTRWYPKTVTVAAP